MQTPVTLAAAFVLAASVTAPAAAQSSTLRTFQLEPETGSVWVSGGFFTQTDVVAEWRTDGQLLGMSGPFSPFTYRSQRVPIGQAGSAPVTLGGRFGVAADFRGVYRRQADGGFAVEEVFGPAASSLGCHETATSSACLLLGSFADARGGAGVLLLDEAQAIKAAYWDGNAYRPARGAEAALVADQGIFSLDQIVWSADGTAALNPSDSGGSDQPTLSYRVYLADGTMADRHVAIGGTDSVSQSHILRQGAAFYLLTRRTAREGGAKTAALFRLDQPFAEAPALAPLGSVTAASGDAVPLGLDTVNAYVVADGKLQALPLAGGPAVALVACAAESAMLLGGSSVSFALAGSGHDAGDLWIACGATVHRLADGRVAESRDAGGLVRGGTVLRDDAGGYDLVGTRADGAFFRLRSGRDLQAARLVPLEAAPAPFDVAWDEPTGPCGAVSGGPVLCRVGSGWQPTDLGIGRVTAVRRAADGWWAAGVKDGRRVVFHRALAGAWEQAGSWDGEGTLRLVRVGSATVAADTGGKAWTLFHAGGTAHDAYPHERSGYVAPAIAGDGLAYDLCPSSAPAGKSNVCAVHEDGRVEAVAGTPAGAYQAAFVPLARGMLAFVDGHPYVLRGIRAIPLGHLFGEFEPLPNQTLEVTATETGDGRAVLRKRASDAGGNQAKLSYFDFDGTQLTPQAPAPSPHAVHRDFGDDDDGSNDNGVYSGGGEPRQAWLGDDGLWRTPQRGALDPLGYGARPVDALFGQARVAPDYANDAAVLGPDVVVATDDGVWTCPLSAATPLTAATAVLPQTTGCARRAALPFVQRLVRLGASWLLQQGTRIVRLASLDGAPQTLGAGAATLLGGQGARAVWAEGATVVTYDETAGTLARSPLPVEAGALLAVGEAWACGKGGLFHRDGDAWTARPEVAGCLALWSGGDDTVVATATELHHCTAGRCAALAVLPRRFDPDGVLGVVPGAAGAQPAVALGSRIYRISLATGELTDVTPAAARGAALLAPVTRLGADGAVATYGGGTLILPRFPGDGSRHVRIE